jgi:hypothetical protein
MKQEIQNNRNQILIASNYPCDAPFWEVVGYENNEKFEM